MMVKGVNVGTASLRKALTCHINTFYRWYGKTATYIREIEYRMYTIEHE